MDKKPGSRRRSVEGAKRTDERQPLEPTGIGANRGEVNESEATATSGDKDYFDESSGGRRAGADFEDAAESALEPSEDKGDREND